ncbi:uncharacterized protein LOC127805538 [Diospyros lotus]|uniref:uncharacterized protein LOC127805538 n=1 Tax=Diospyros lotus TaxID=55363 RepID=UPI0022544553|nr:uncharacterized protein LOC127805538 [Diospyros lotus]
MHLRKPIVSIAEHCVEAALGINLISQRKIQRSEFSTAKGVEATDLDVAVAIFLCRNRGIEVNLVKVKVILDMPALRNIKEVQSLTGRMTALGRFLFQSAEKGLAKAKNFVWDNEFQEAFSKLKEYLASALVLTKPQ